MRVARVGTTSPDSTGLPMVATPERSGSSRQAGEEIPESPLPSGVGPPRVISPLEGQDSSQAGPTQDLDETQLVLRGQTEETMVVVREQEDRPQPGDPRELVPAASQDH